MAAKKKSSSKKKPSSGRSTLTKNRPFSVFGAADEKRYRKYELDEVSKGRTPKKKKEWAKSRKKSK